MKKKINLKDFICALSYQHQHYTQKPIMLSCGHAACFKCLNDFKKTTGLKQVKCLKCNKKNSLEIDYFESDLMKNYMNDYSDKILDDLKNKFEETQIKAKGKNILLLFILLNFLIYIKGTINVRTSIWMFRSIIGKKRLKYEQNQ